MRRAFWAKKTADLKLPQRQLAKGMAILLVAMLIPLLWIAVYNYPADDDFGYVLPVAQAWLDTGSLWQVLKAVAYRSYQTCMGWQGYFVSNALFCLNPMVFDIRLYFVGTWFMLALLCLSVAYLIKGITGALRASSSVFWIFYTACMVLALQFMPSISNGIYWYNSAQYITAVCILFINLGILLRGMQPGQSRGRRISQSICAGLCGFLLGGSFYAPALGGIVLLAFVAAAALKNRAANRLQCCLSLGLAVVALCISMMSPGNALRQEGIGQALPPLQTIVTAVLDGFDLVGKWITPQLLAALLLICPVLWKPLKDSRFRFQHPLLVMIALYGCLSASLAPGIYTGFGYDTERYLNVVYFYFLLFAMGCVIYGEGWLIRQLEQSGKNNLLAAAQPLGQRFTAGYLAIVLALTVLGGFANTIMNTPSISAAKSIVSGEAATFLSEMQERQEYMRVTPSEETVVESLSCQPYVFKKDTIPFQGIYGKRLYMKRYFEAFAQSQQNVEP